MTRRHNSSPRSDSRRMGRGLIGVLVLLLAGCSSTRYTAHSLPAQFRAKSQANPRLLDLSRLAASYPSSELIANGDVLEVTVSTGLSQNETVTNRARVGDDGAASLPGIGNIPLAGLELEDAEIAVSAACIQKGLYRHPHVTVTMHRRRVNKVTVIGGVEKEGSYEIPRDSCDLLAAIYAAGGLAKDAGTNVEIRSPRGELILPGGESEPSAPIADAGTISPIGHSTITPAGSERPRSVRIDLVSAVREGGGQYLLPDGAVVKVEKREPQPVQVIGLVKDAGRKEFPLGHDLHVLDAVALAGGPNNPLADKVYVIRPVTTSPDPAVIEVSMKKAKQSGEENLLLAPGDIVSVEQTPTTILLDTLRLVNFGFGASLPLMR